MNKILRFVLCLVHAVIESAELIDGEYIILSVRPQKRYARRCPVCHASCVLYDTSPSPRKWRTLDLGATKCYLEYRISRVKCPVHGVHTEDVPWARPDSGFTRTFEDEVAWLSVHCNRSVVSELMRIDWKTVGPICKRVYEDLERNRGCSRFDGLVRIGIDETSYKKGHKYMTVVVDHDTDRVVWACKGYGKSQLNSFFDLLTEKQRSSIRAVTADGAKWIAEVVEARCPNAERVMDPFHVVSWATEALDELRKQAWRTAHAIDKCKPKYKRGRPKKTESRKVPIGTPIKDSKYPLLKNPENLSASQTATLEAIARSDPKLYRGYLLKEGLRDVFKAENGEQAKERLEDWLSRACRSKIPEFVELSRKVRKRKDTIVRAVELGISNARIEAINNKIKLTIRMGYGFRNIDNLIALVMLRCSNLKPQLPGRIRIV